MPDKKPTDAEIIKALECCISDKDDVCLECPLQNDCFANADGNSEVKELALDPINRLQADRDNYKQIAENQQKIILDKAFENKRLRTSNDALRMANELCKGWEERAKAKAYKECIEKVKEEIAKALESNYKARAEKENKEINLYLDNLFWNYCTGKIDCLRGIDDFCNNLLKELVGEDNG